MKSTAIIFFCFAIFASAKLAMAGTPKITPDVLTIDDFESGVAKWDNTGTGEIKLFSDPVKGKVMLWSAEDDGIGHIVFKNLNRKTIDFSEYDILMFDVKITGRPIWNLNPIIQQYPAIYGYRGLFYSIDTLHPFGKWYTYSQDLTKWENAWPNTYDEKKQEFQFEISQLAGPGGTKIYLDNIRLVKNPLGVKTSVPGEWCGIPDGSQTTHFKIPLANKKKTPITVKISLDPDAPGTINKLNLEFGRKTVRLLPGETQELLVSMTAPANVVKSSPPYYGEMARIRFEIDGVPGLKLFTELTAGTKPSKTIHPRILCLPAKARELRGQYKNLKSRAKMDKRFLQVVKDGEKALAESREYPPSAAPGSVKDPVSGTSLVKIDVPNLPYNVYQDPKSGRVHSGPVYDAGMLGWLKKHMANSAAARRMGMAYLVTGRKEFAHGVADILRKYIIVYPKLPKVPYPPASPVGSDCSGVTRIGGTYMRERVWLGNLAVALDCIHDSREINEDEIRSLTQNVFVPSGTTMMNHRVGVMNLQWMIDSAVFLAGIAADEPGLVTRALTDSHGIYNMMRIGFLEDGMWWENPSYQGVCKLAAYPVIATSLRNGIMKMSPSLLKILLSSYKMNAPDGRSPTLGTGGFRDFAFENAGIMMMANFLKDPETSWVLRNKKLSGGTYNCYPFALFGMSPAKIAEDKCVSPIPEKSVNFPVYGGIAMRIPKTDHYTYLHYGRELVHGHRNKLSINAYGEGGWFMRNVMGGYGHNFHDFLETVASSNTIMIDGKNPDADTGKLLFRESRGGMEMISAIETGAWKNVEHERSVVLTSGPLIVVDRCLSNKQRLYDCLYHANYCGGLNYSGIPLADKSLKSFGDAPIYKSLRPAGQVKSANEIPFKRKNGSGVLVSMAGDGKVFLFNVKDAIRASQGLLCRKKGDNVSFATAFLPFKKGVSAKLAIKAIPVKDASGKTVGLECGQAYIITANNAEYTVLVNYTGKTLSADTLTGTKRIMVKLKSK